MSRRSWNVIAPNRGASRCSKSSALCGFRRLSRDEDQLARILRSVRTLVEACVQVLNLESAPGEQVLRLESKLISHCEGMNQALLAAICVRDVVDELDLKELIEAVMCSGPVLPNDAPAIWRREFRFVTALLPNYLIHQRVEVWVEQVENQSTIVSEMTPNGVQTRNLIVDRN